MNRNLPSWLTGRVLLPVPRAGTDADGKRKGKATTFTGWSREDLDPASVTIREDENVALRLDGIINIEGDCPEWRALAPKFLPRTSNAGRESCGFASHYFYIRNVDLPSLKISDVDDAKTTLGELRTGPGHYSVVWGEYPRKDDPTVIEAVRFASDRDPAEVDDLLRDYKLLATAVLIARHWPGASRHDLIVACAGLLGKLKITAADAIHILEQVTLLKEGDVWSDPHDAVHATYAKLADGNKRVKGGPEAAKLFTGDGSGVVGKIRELYCAPKDARNRNTGDGDIARLNERFFIVDVGSDTCVGELTTITTDEAGARPWTHYVFRSFADFKRKLIKEPPVSIPDGQDADGNTKYRTVPLADHWLEHPDGRQYERLLYAPEGSGIVLGKRDLNGWRGFTVTPAPGDWSITRAFLLDIICNSDTELNAWLINWLADLFQRPGRHAETALVLKGEQGIGKNKFADGIISDSFDAHHARKVMSTTQALGEFNDVLSGAVVFVYDEVEMTSAEVSRAKGMITSDTIPINRKGIAVAHERSMLHMLFLSNHKNPIKIDADDRRFAFFDVSEDRKKDYEFFASIDAELANGGRAAMLYELIAHKVDRNLLREAPANKAKREARMHNLKPAQWFVLHETQNTEPEAWAASNGVPPSKDGYARWLKSKVIANYLVWRGERGYKTECPNPGGEIAEVIAAAVGRRRDGKWRRKERGFEYNRDIKIKGKVTSDFWTLPAWDVWLDGLAESLNVEREQLLDVTPGAEPEDVDIPF
jgi:hypothetical protein